MNWTVLYSVHCTVYLSVLTFYSITQWTTVSPPCLSCLSYSTVFSWASISLYNISYLLFDFSFRFRFIVFKAQIETKIKHDSKDRYSTLGTQHPRPLHLSWTLIQNHLTNNGPYNWEGSERIPRVELPRKYFRENLDKHGFSRKAIERKSCRCNFASNKWKHF